MTNNVVNFQDYVNNTNEPTNTVEQDPVDDIIDEYVAFYATLLENAMNQDEFNLDDSVVENNLHVIRRILYATLRHSMGKEDDLNELVNEALQQFLDTI